MNKEIWIIANWKSNKTIQEALDWVGIVGPKLERKEFLKIVVCPTFSALSEVKKEIMVGGYPLLVGAQDISPFGEGAYTGEEPAEILKQFVDLSIIGHSERRRNFREKDEMVEEKVKQALAQGVIPLVCVQSPDAPVPNECKLVAYEPIFAIGTGNPDTPENASGIANKLKQRYGQELEVLYGGSVTSRNCKSFTTQENINGLLIGGASLDANEFVKIINNCLSI